MATYKGTEGYTVQKLASDPAASANTEGQVWYNTTTSLLKFYNGSTVRTVTIS